jgi:RNA polymerase sigma-70 factor, ECF subfamily
MATHGEGFDDALGKARAGDEAGFRYLWRSLHPRLLRYLHVFGCQDPEDVASETWLQIVRDLHRFRGGEDEFRGWLFTIGRHRAIDATRARIRSQERMMTAQATALAAEQVDENAVEAELLEGLSTRQAITLVAELPRDQAEAVALRIIAGLETARVAGILGKSPGAVRVALHRGLRSLAADPRVRDLATAEQ